MTDPLLELFPLLARAGYQITSPRNEDYNCIAWAAGDDKICWWPVPLHVKDVFWPAGATRAETLGAFREAFATLSYVECDAADMEPDFEKIALFADANGMPLHAARQLPEGRWTSKLGELEDIEHALHDLEGEAYGTVVLLMKRDLPTAIQSEPARPFSGGA
jgi:hypothetical protein